VKGAISTASGRLLALVSAIVLVDVLFYSAITPLLPSYVDDLGLTKGQAGVLAGSYALGTLVASLPAGWLAAHRGARPTLLSGLALLAVSCVAFGFATKYEVLVGARLFQGVGGAAAWAAGLSWLISAAPREKRGQLIGTALGTAIAGAMGGPVLGAIAEALGHALVFSAVAVIAAVLATGVALTPVAGEPPPSGRLWHALRDRRVLAGAWLTALPALFFGTFNVLAPLRLDDFGVGAAGVAGVFLVAAAVEAIASPLVGRLSDRRGRALPLRAGLAGVLVACFLLPLPDRAWVLGAVVVGAAAVAGMIWAPAMALLSDGAEMAGLAQGFAFGLVNLAWAGGQVGGSAGGARLAEATSDAVPYVVLAVLCAATLTLLVRPRVASVHG
jgi:predicted MFS family arabinose efflux permease